MRIAAIGASLLLALASCSTTKPSSDSPFVQPNPLMAEEISRRIEQIPFQHREELLENLVWLAERGEQCIPSLLTGLRHDSTKVRASCAWMLGRLRDRRTIPNLQQAMHDDDVTVRMECARTLVLMGDLAWSPNLIEGLDHERKEVRYLCHEALKTATGHDFGYDHLNQNEGDLRLSVLRWRQWWGEYSGDAMFAASYQQKHSLQGQPAAPQGETKPMPTEPETVTPPVEAPVQQVQAQPVPVTPNASEPMAEPAPMPMPTPTPAPRSSGN